MDSVDPDQTAPLRAVSSGSTLCVFAFYTYHRVVKQILTCIMLSLITMNSYGNFLYKENVF